MKRATLWGAELVTSRTAGLEFKGTRRTHAHLRWTVWRLSRAYPKAKLVILQPCYNSGVAASAGTHDYDAVLDVMVVGLDWPEAQEFLRGCGWAAWWRHTGSWSERDAWHIHMCSIPPNLSQHPTENEVLGAYHSIGIEVGQFVPGQVRDYYAHSFGLKGQHQSGADHSPFPRDINATVFKEDDMGYLDWPEEDRKALVGDVVNGVFNRVLGDTKKAFGPIIQAIYKRGA